MALRSLKLSFLSDLLVFTAGATIALLVFWGIYSSFSLATSHVDHHSLFSPVSTEANDPPAATFYDDPGVCYTIDCSIHDWDSERRDWLRLHPTPTGGAHERVLMVRGSQPDPCKNPAVDHLLLCFFKNKVDYCRRHGVELFYNTPLLHPAMRTFWVKLLLLRAAMFAHPEAEWIWTRDEGGELTAVRRGRSHRARCKQLDKGGRAEPEASGWRGEVTSERRRKR